jgi:membrane fusion protein, heavy metal efflux system
MGALGQLELQTGGTMTALAVPSSAVLLEENRSVVYVQLGGETFERRIVTTGIQDREWIEILSGLEEGERVVTEGAYDVALAARSTEVPEHGHVH